MNSETPTSAVQDYLKALHRLGGAEAVVPTADIAAMLDVRPPSVSGMLKRLAREGWVEYEPGHGARLSARGLRESRRVVRRHRLVELFLHKVLGLDWSEVDAEAEALEHAISPRVEQALAAYLGQPVEDPHGHPIPTADGQLAARDLKPLTAFAAGDAVLIREATDEHPERLRRWRELGLVPGAVVRVRDHQLLDGIYELEVAGKTLRLGAEGLGGLKGERVP